MRLHYISGKIEKITYLDLERPSDWNKIQNAGLFLQDKQDTLIILDEIQRTPDLFSLLRSEVDRKGNNGQFIITELQMEQNWI